MAPQMPRQGKTQKKKARAENYHRPFVPIDSEGQNYPGADIVYDGVRYPRHDTYLWGAASDDGRPPSWLMAPQTLGIDKRPLDAIQILDWLLSLPEQFGPAVFVMFSSATTSRKFSSTFLTRRRGRSRSGRHIRSIRTSGGASPIPRCCGRATRSPMSKGNPSTRGGSPIPISPISGRSCIRARTPGFMTFSASSSPHSAPWSRAWSTAGARPRKKPILSPR